MQQQQNKKICIIGGGPAGYKCALELKKLDQSLEVTLIEKYKLGGTCLHLGCIPSKQLHAISDLSDYAQALKKNLTILEKAIASELKQASVNVIIEEACVDQSRQSIKLSNGKTLEYDILIVATGSRPRRLQEFPQAITSDELFSEASLGQGFKDKYTCIGGGYIGIEIASMLARHGKKIKIYETLDQILGFLDHDIRLKFLQSLQQQGIEVHTGFKDLQQIDRDAEIFLAIGRETVYPKGIDPNNLGDNIYVIGDASQEIALAHYAYMQARALAYKICGKEFTLRKDLVPLVVFSHPELASIGFTENQALEKFGQDDVESIKINWASNAKARIIGSDRGLTKWVIQKRNGKILGCHLIGESATDLISLVIPIINQDLSVDDMKNWIYPHPTLGEIFSF